MLLYFLSLQALVWAPNRRHANKMQKKILQRSNLQSFCMCLPALNIKSPLRNDNR